MKKYAIILVACLLAVLLTMKYRQTKTAVPAGILTPQTTAESAVGVPLPSNAASYIAQSQSQVPASTFETPRPLNPEHTTGANFAPPAYAGNYGSLATIFGSTGDEPICKNRTLNNLLSAHGTLWGRSNPVSRLNNKENDRVYELLGKYFSCQAVASDNLDMCNFLPAADLQGNNKKGGDAPIDACLVPAGRILFFAYATGQSKNDLPCKKVFEGSGFDKLPASSMELCSAAAGGFVNMCKKFPNKGACNAAFPTERSACSNIPCTPKYAGDCDASKIGADCLTRYALYAAIAGKNSGSCPAEYRTECEALFTKSSAGCASVLSGLGKAYCEASMRPEPKQAPIAMPKGMKMRKITVE